MMTTRHILIFGGTGEARQLAERLAIHTVLRVSVSLAGRTSKPLALAGEVRIGGFGGAHGLARYIQENHVDFLVDATHPFAARMAQNAVLAARESNVPLITLSRPAWEAKPGDSWRMAGNMAQAVALLDETPRRIFLAIGRQEVAAFMQAPQHHYIVRSVEPVDASVSLPNTNAILARGPFSEEDERALLLDCKVDIVVTKNSGGTATYGKIAAARSLGLPVVMVARPKTPGGHWVQTVDEAERQVHQLACLCVERGE